MTGRRPLDEDLHGDAFFPFACLQCICASSQVPASLPALPRLLGAELFVCTRAQRGTLARPLLASTLHSDAHVQQQVMTREGSALPKATQLGRQSSGSRSTGDSCSVTPPLTQGSPHTGLVTASGAGGCCGNRDQAHSLIRQTLGVIKPVHREGERPGLETYRLAVCP